MDKSHPTVRSKLPSGEQPIGLPRCRQVPRRGWANPAERCWKSGGHMVGTARHAEEIAREADTHGHVAAARMAYL